MQMDGLTTCTTYFHLILLHFLSKKNALKKKLYIGREKINGLKYKCMILGLSP